MPEIRSSSPYDYSGPPPSTSPQKVSEQPPLNNSGDDRDDDQPGDPKKHTIRNIISTIALFLAAPLLALFLIVFVIQSYEVDGPSMQETLHNKDLLIVDKLDRTWSRLTRKDFIPPRYEIIIFSRDESGGLSGSNVRQLVKRVIALPGERVIVNDGHVTVYNSQHPDGFNPDANQEYSKTIKTTPGNVDLTVRPGQVFVLGDNRTNSLDSRYFGPIEAHDIIGKLGMRIFPLNKAQTF